MYGFAALFVAVVIVLLLVEGMARMEAKRYWLNAANGLSSILPRIPGFY